MDASDLLLVSAVATAVATVVSALLSLVARYLDRKHVAWTAIDARADWTDHSHPIDNRSEAVPPTVSATLANVGDSLALGVRAHGAGCTAVLSRTTPSTSSAWHNGYRSYPVMPAMRPGEEIDLVVDVDPAHWDSAEVGLSWTPSPNPFRRRKVTWLRVSDLATRPVYHQRDPTDLDSIAPKPAPEPSTDLLVVSVDYPAGMSRWARNRGLKRRRP